MEKSCDYLPLKIIGAGVLLPLKILVSDDRDSRSIKIWKDGNGM